MMCEHKGAYIDRACCPGGTQDCDCRGTDHVACPADNCTGIKGDEVDELFERLS